MGHLLVMTNHHNKLEDPWSMSSLVIDRTRFVYGPTDQLTDRRTNICKAIYPLFFEGSQFLNEFEPTEVRAIDL